MVSKGIGTVHAGTGVAQLWGGGRSVAWEELHDSHGDREQQHGEPHDAF